MRRGSKLNEAEHCGFAGSYQDAATSVWGLMGDAFHAAVAAHYRPTEERFREERAVAVAQLQDSERDDVLRLVTRLTESWAPDDGAVFETPVGLDRNGCFVAHGDPAAMTQGTADCAWATEDDDNQTTAWILDFKSGARAEWNVPPPGQNLQIASYGFALADKYGASRMKLGIYLAHEDKWLWETINLDSAAGTDLFARVKAASLRDDDEQIEGPHCGECFVRLKCPAHLLPALDDAAREYAMAPMTAGADPSLITPDRVVRLINASKAMEAVAEAGKDWAKAFVREHGPVVLDGKQWGPVQVKGREGTSVKRLKEAGLYDRAVAVGAVGVGPPTMMHRWTNVKEGI